MKTRRAFFAVLLFALSGIPRMSALAAVAEPKEPSYTVRGPVLESADLKFRVTAPAGWSWSEDRSARQPEDHRYSFVARADARTFFRLTVRGRGMNENSERSVGEFLQGVKISNSKSGISITDVRSSPLRSKAGAGFAYSYAMHFPQDATALADGYVLAADRFYMLQYVSADRSRLADFSRFIASFELVRPAAR